MKDNKRKATIVTIYDPMPNIGNRLQNYAAQELLKSFDLEVDTLSFQKSILSGKKKIKYITQKITGYRLPGDKMYWKLFPQRIKAFENFNKKYINTQQIKKIKQNYRPISCSMPVCNCRFCDCFPDLSIEIFPQFLL